MKIRVVCSASSRYILYILVEVVHSRIFDEALLASIATKVAQAFEDALEAIKQVCVRGMWKPQHIFINSSHKLYYHVQQTYGKTKVFGRMRKLCSIGSTHLGFFS